MERAAKPLSFPISCHCPTPSFMGASARRTSTRSRILFRWWCPQRNNIRLRVDVRLADAPMKLGVGQWQDIGKERGFAALSILGLIFGLCLFRLVFRTHVFLSPFYCRATGT